MRIWSEGNIYIYITYTYINKLRHIKVRNHARPPSFVEMRDYCGPLYLSGVLHGSKISTDFGVLMELEY